MGPDDFDDSAVAALAPLAATLLPGPRVACASFHTPRGLCSPPKRVSSSSSRLGPGARWPTSVPPSSPERGPVGAPRRGVTAGNCDVLSALKASQSSCSGAATLLPAEAGARGIGLVEVIPNKPLAGDRSVRAVYELAQGEAGDGEGEGADTDWGRAPTEICTCSDMCDGGLGRESKKDAPGCAVPWIVSVPDWAPDWRPGWKVCSGGAVVLVASSKSPHSSSSSTVLWAAGAVETV